MLSIPQKHICNGHARRSKQKKKADIYNEFGKPKKKININKHIIIVFRNPYILAITKQPSIISDEYYSCNANAQNQKKKYIHSSEIFMVHFQKANTKGSDTNVEIE